MKKSHKNRFLTTNQDYGSFYTGRLQYTQINPDEIALELELNDQVRNERCHLSSIAYDIMFDPIISRRQLKYINFKNQTNEQRQHMIKNAIEYYTTFIKCIYANKLEKNPQLSNTVLELVANELFLLNSEISADELAEKMIAITVPQEYLGMPVINPDKPYPGTEAECTDSPGLQRLLEQIQTTNTILAESKQQFDPKVIDSQPMEGVRYIYNPFTTVRTSYRI